MNCEQIQPNLLDYATGTLSEPEAKEVKAHLTECAECVALLKEEVAFSKRLSALPEDQPTQDVWPVILEKTKPRKARSFAWINGIFATNLRKTAAAAAALTVLLASVYSLKPEQPAHTVAVRQAKAVTVKWSDDPLGKHTDAMLDYVENM